MPHWPSSAARLGSASPTTASTQRPAVPARDPATAHGRGQRSDRRPTPPDRFRQREGEDASCLASTRRASRGSAPALKDLNVAVGRTFLSVLRAWFYRLEDGL